MALPDQYVKIEARFATVLNNRQEVVTWWQPDAPIDMSNGQDEADALAVLAEGQFGIPMKNVLSATDATFTGAHVHLNLNGVTFISSSTIIAGAGVVESATQAENVAVVLRKRTDHGGKTGRGRWFMGAVPEEMSDAGRLTDAAMGPYQTLADALQTIMSTSRANYGPRHLSRKDNAMYPIRSASAHRYTRSQRRRLVRLFS